MTGEGSPVPVGNFNLRLPRQPWLRSMLQGTPQDWRRKETYMDMHVCGVCMCVCAHMCIVAGMGQRQDLNSDPGSVPGPLPCTAAGV